MTPCAALSACRPFCASPARPGRVFSARACRFGGFLALAFARRAVRQFIRAAAPSPAAAAPPLGGPAMPTLMVQPALAFVAEGSPRSQRCAVLEAPGVARRTPEASMLLVRAPAE